MKRSLYIFLLLLVAGNSFAQSRDPQFCRIVFEHYANGKMITLNDSIYTNKFGESYSVSKLKYYVSNIHLITGKTTKSKPSVYLINAAAPYHEIMLAMPSDDVIGVEFLLGVDSALNCSGAQEGALDPLNDMFWTWNNGYVMFKLEGKSASSNAVDNRIEQHVGGYKGEYRTMRKVYIPVKRAPSVSFLRQITIRMDLDKYWSEKNKISVSPVITLPGATAAAAADNFPGMFTLEGICCYPL